MKEPDLPPALLNLICILFGSKPIIYNPNPIMKLPLNSPTRLILFVVFIVLTTIVACRKNIFDRKPETQLTKTYDQYEVNYQSSTADSILHFEIEISKTGSFSDVIDETLDIDLKGKKYLNNIYKMLQDRASDSKYSSITEQQAKEICTALRHAIEEHTASLTAEQIKAPNIQGMYMSLAFARRILKNKTGVSLMEKRIMAKRNAFRSTTSPGTTTPGTTTPGTVPDPTSTTPGYVQDVYEGYELGLSGFVLNEDIIVNRQALLNIVNSDDASGLYTGQGLYVFQEVLNNIPYSTFTLKDLLAELSFYEAQHPENITASGCGIGWWPSGSSHGCCGNYSGCCYHVHWVCYVHDKICTNCKPRWFCFSGCVPDPVEVPGQKPFTFTENGTEVRAFIPTPLPALIYYKTAQSDLSKDVPLLSTTIVFNSADKKYYTSNTYNTFVPEGYYDSPTEVNDDLHRYYHIQSGIITEVYLGVTPTNFPSN